jgi:hypothetical protein
MAHVTLPIKLERTEQTRLNGALRPAIELMAVGNICELGVRVLDVSCWNCRHPSGTERRSLA